MVLLVLTTLAAARPSDACAQTPRLDRDKLDHAVKAVVAEHGTAIKAGIWIGGATGDAWYSSQADGVLPTASAVKTAFLVELFAKYSGAIDQPPPGLAEVLRDDHPAVAHFTVEQRDEIRKGLTDASVRRLGGVMMGSVPASNLVYNAAANAVTALLGGPEALTKAIRERDPAFAAIAVRRYMLAARNVTGDNEATPAALAAVLQRLAAREVPGVPASTVEDVRRGVLAKDDPRLGRHFLKNGDLASDPITRVESGWFDDGRRTIVYVVMTTQAGPGGQPRDEAHRRLAATAGRLAETAIAAARKSAP